MTDTPRRGWSRLPFWIRALVVVGLAGPALTWFGHRQGKEGVIVANERAVSAALKMLTSAQADFRGNDRDGNRIQDFWTADVSSLQALGLIDREIAAADSLPAHPRLEAAVPYHGYYFRVLTTDESGNPYRTDTNGDGSNGAKKWNHSKFAVCAYPAQYGVTGRHTFSVNEGNTIFKQDLGGLPREVWPADDMLKLEYSVVD